MATPTSSAACRASSWRSNAEDVSQTLWTSEQVSGRDRLGLFAKFTPPTVAGGKLFVATYGDNEPLRFYGGNNRPTQFPNY